MINDDTEPVKLTQELRVVFRLNADQRLEQVSEGETYEAMLMGDRTVMLYPRAMPWMVHTMRINPLSDGEFLAVTIERDITWKSEQL